jgi:hypothetical protein
VDHRNVQRKNLLAKERWNLTQKNGHIIGPPDATALRRFALTNSERVRKFPGTRFRISCVTLGVKLDNLERRKSSVARFTIALIRCWGVAAPPWTKTLLFDLIAAVAVSAVTNFIRRQSSSRPYDLLGANKSLAFLYMQCSCRTR